MALIFGAGGGALECPAATDTEDALGEVDGKGGGALDEGVVVEEETKGSAGGALGGGALAESPAGRCRLQTPWVETPPGPASLAVKDC